MGFLSNLFYLLTSKKDLGLREAFYKALAEKKARGSKGIKKGDKILYVTKGSEIPMVAKFVGILSNGHWLLRRPRHKVTFGCPEERIIT